MKSKRDGFAVLRDRRVLAWLPGLTTRRKGPEEFPATEDAYL